MTWVSASMTAIAFPPPLLPCYSRPCLSPRRGEGLQNLLRSNGQRVNAHPDRISDGIRDSSGGRHIGEFADALHMQRAHTFAALEEFHPHAGGVGNIGHLVVAQVGRTHSPLLDPQILP